MLKNKWIKIFLLASFLLFCVITAVSAGNLKDAFKVNDGTLDDPLDAAAFEAGYSVKKLEGDHLNPIFATVIQTGLTFLGVAFILLMLYGGFLWMSDQGNEEQVTKAKKMITSAVIGLIIVVSAYAISWYVVSTLGQAALETSEISE